MNPSAAPIPVRLGPAGLHAQLYPARRLPDGAARALLLFLHGGHFTDGSLASGQARCEMLAQAGADVVSLDYPLAPGHRFPAALGAAFEALQALATPPVPPGGDGPSALVVAGELAGGNLAAALALMARDQGAPALAGQLLISPMLDPQLATASMRRGACGGGQCAYARGWQAYLGGNARADHPYAAPLNASRLSGVAPALVLRTPGHPLNDEARRYAAALRDQGVSVTDLALPAEDSGQMLEHIRQFLNRVGDRALPIEPQAGRKR